MRGAKGVSSRADARSRGRCVIRLGVVRESHERERRVAIAPPSVKKLLALGLEVAVERGAGEPGERKEAAE